MLTAKNAIGIQIAWKAQKEDKPFYCSECEQEVTLKKGPVKAHHFAHKPPVNCVYGLGESENHLQTKRAIYEALLNHPQCSKCELERKVGSVRPDISLRIGDQYVAIEVQRSNISNELILSRFKEYSRLGIYLLWVIPFPPPVQKEIYNIREWQKLLKALYYGNLYFYQSDAYLISVRLDRSRLYVEEGYTSEGELVGGYYRRAKRRMDVVEVSEPLHIAENFSPHKRDMWKDIPSGLIWTATS